MGDYAITKIILKIKPEYQQKLNNFIDFKDLNPCNTLDYDLFWESLDTLPFYYQGYVFGKGSSHAYTTSLGDSDIHIGSDFYVNDRDKTRFGDGFWFVEFSSKVGRHREFLDRVVPYIADAWVGLYGDEYSRIPSQLQLNRELVVSTDPVIQKVISDFIIDFDKDYKDNNFDKYPF